MTEKTSEQELVSNSLHSFAMLRQAAAEYGNFEFKFYKHGFFKYKKSGDDTFLIEDIYVIPEFRGTPVSKIMMEDFNAFMNLSGISFYYGRVMKADLENHQKRLDKFLSWGLKALDNRYSSQFTIVHGVVR